VFDAITLINAPIETVWQTLMGFESYKEWSTMLHYLGGEPKVGNPIQLRLVFGKTDYKFSPRVIDMTANKRFAWKATTFRDGIFDGEHSFELMENRKQIHRIMSINHH